MARKPRRATGGTRALSTRRSPGLGHHIVAGHQQRCGAGVRRTGRWPAPGKFALGTGQPARAEPADVGRLAAQLAGTGPRRRHPRPAVAMAQHQAGPRCPGRPATARVNAAVARPASQSLGLWPAQPRPVVADPEQRPGHAAAVTDQPPLRFCLGNHPAAQREFRQPDPNPWRGAGAAGFQPAGQSNDPRQWHRRPAGRQQPPSLGQLAARRAAGVRPAAAVAADVAVPGLLAARQRPAAPGPVPARLPRTARPAATQQRTPRGLRQCAATGAHLCRQCQSTGQQWRPASGD